MITPLKQKLLLNGYESPHWTVSGRKFYNKYHAIDYCQQVGCRWPTYTVWGESGSFRRPTMTFDETVKKQCELLSDTSNKVRLWYSGGTDSNFILHKMLETKSKLNELAVYRRFPGLKDTISNEFDQFDILSVTKKTLAHYGIDVPIKFYDILPEHYSFYSKNLDELFFPYTNLDFFVHGVHTIAELYPNILDDGFVNVMGHAMPYVNEQNQFYWLDIDFNMSQPDPFVVNFYSDPRNKDLTVNMAYTIKDFKKKGNKNKIITDYSGSNMATVTKMKNDAFNFPLTGTPLDDNYDQVTVPSSHCWLLGRKQIVTMANAQRTEIGRQTFDNFVNFYENIKDRLKDYCNYGSIYNGWIGSYSEHHTLLDD